MSPYIFSYDPTAPLGSMLNPYPPDHPFPAPILNPAAPDLSRVDGAIPPPLSAFNQPFPCSYTAIMLHAAPTFPGSPHPPQPPSDHPPSSAGNAPPCVPPSVMSNASHSPPLLGPPNQLSGPPSVASSPPSDRTVWPASAGPRALMPTPGTVAAASLSAASQRSSSSTSSSKARRTVPQQQVEQLEDMGAPLPEQTLAPSDSISNANTNVSDAHNSELPLLDQIAAPVDSASNIDSTAMPGSETRFPPHPPPKTILPSHL